jgi:LemA protein
VKEAESNIGVTLRKKISHVNQLVQLANKYMDRESLMMLKISQDNTEAAIKTMYNQSGNVMSTIQGLAQRFPEFRSEAQANKIFDAIGGCENDLQMFRMMFNNAIKEYNNKRNGLPHVLYAGFLGFRTGRYLELDTVEAEDSFVQKQVLSDDGERLNELLGMAGSKVLGATKTMAEQGKLLAEKAAAKVQAEIAARSLPAGDDAVAFHYLDAARNPMGPVTRQQLDDLFQSGTISHDTDILPAGAKAWTKYQQLAAGSMQAPAPGSTPAGPGSA